MKSLPSGPPLTEADIFYAMPGSSVLLLPDTPHFTIAAATAGYLQATGRSKGELIGKGIFDVFPNSLNDLEKRSKKKLRSSLAHVLLEKEMHSLVVQRYDHLNADGTFEERYWFVENKPVLNGEGEVVYLVHSAIDVTDERKSALREENIKGVQKAYDLFMNAPVIIGILRGDEYVIELANEGLLEVWGRTEEVVGKPLLQAIPELEAQGFIALLENVRTTGEPFYAYEFPIALNRHGKVETLYFDFVYKPIYDKNNNRRAGSIISVGHNVTQQVRAREKEQEREVKYRTIIESMDQGFCVLEMICDDTNHPIDYRFLEANPGFEKQTGLVNAVGKTAKELVPNLEAHWLELYGKVALSGEAIRFTEHSEAMGRWFDVYAFHIGDRASRKVALLFTDITEQKKADQTIRESEARFRNLADESPMFVFIIDADPVAPVSYWNKTWLDYTGQTKEEALGRAWDGILHPADVPVVMMHYVPAFEKRDPYVIPSVRVKRHDGQYRWHTFKGHPRYLSGGAFNGYVGVGFDIHEQKLAEEALRQSEARTRLAVETAQLGTYEIDVQAQSIIYSLRAAEIFGLDLSEQLPYTEFTERIHPDDVPVRTKAHDTALKTGNLVYETRIIRPDQSIRWIRLNGRYFSNGPDTQKLIGTIMDITEEKRAADLLEQKIEERTQELKQVNEQLKQFTYAASHDLQEPLRKISFFLDRLLANLGPALSNENEKIAQRIQHTTGRMKVLIDDLLAYSNTTLGVTNFEDIRLGDIVNEVLDDMEATIIEKGAVVNVSELPVIKGDQRQLRQLFQNLISNAVKYQKKDETPRVDVSSKLIRGGDTDGPLSADKRDDKYHLIEIKDNGIGFAPDDAERIFRLFQRLHGRSEYEGTGIGLAIVQKVIENHYGYIWAESTPGTGATFKVLLPAK